MKAASTEPVLVAGVTTGAVVAVIMAGLQWMRLMGWLDWSEDQFSGFMTFIGAALPLAASVAGALWARQRVTPTADPQIKTETGKRVPLVRADTHEPPPAAQRAAQRAGHS